MLYREFGRTGKKVSLIGFGGMRFKEEDYLDGDYSKALALIHRAHALGINYFDTAPGYCHDHSEKILGQAFKTMERSSFYISTKCGLGNAQHSGEGRRMIEQSLERLNVDKVDFYNMWSIKSMAEYREFLKKDGIYAAALQAQSEGLIDHICFTTHMSGQEIAQVANDGLFEGVTLGYNAVNFAYRQEGLEACHAAGLGIVTMNPLGGGLIPTYSDYFAFLRRGEDSLVVSALKFILGQNKATVALVGFSALQEVEKNILATQNLPSPEELSLDEMRKNLSSELNSLCTTCAYCDTCPAGIPIPQLLEAYNLYILSSGDREACLNRLRNHWGVSSREASRCTACGQCEALCTQKLPIIKRLEEMASFA
ncbi:MAG: aldo/keto reductase [Sphaerochaetaceae bacterium]